MNNDNKYQLLCVIDVFSRKVFVRIVKNRRDIADRMNEILSDNQPIVLQTCNKKEFTSNSFIALLNQHNIRQSIGSINEMKSKQAYIERFKRTLVDKLLHSKIDKLDEIVAQYNNTKQSKLNDTPNNRYEQNPSRGIEYKDIHVKRRKTKHHSRSTNERKKSVLMIMM
jgi:transposase InsO family protein